VRLRDGQGVLAATAAQLEQLLAVQVEQLLDQRQLVADALDPRRVAGVEVRSGSGSLVHGPSVPAASPAREPG